MFNSTWCFFSKRTFRCHLHTVSHRIITPKRAKLGLYSDPTFSKIPAGRIERESRKVGDAGRHVVRAAYVIFCNNGDLSLHGGSFSRHNEKRRTPQGSLKFGAHPDPRLTHLTWINATQTRLE